MDTRILELLEKSSEILTIQRNAFSELLNENQNEMKVLGLIDKDLNVNCKLSDLKNYLVMKYGSSVGEILTLSCMYYDTMSYIKKIEHEGKSIVEGS